MQAAPAVGKWRRYSLPPQRFVVRAAPLAADFEKVCQAIRAVCLAPSTGC